MYAAEFPRFPLIEDSDDPFLLGDCFEFSPRFGGDEPVDPLAPLVVLYKMGRRRQVGHFPQLWDNLRSEVDEVRPDVVKLPGGQSLRVKPRVF